ncbi:hypothetical protein B0H16DRAFT_1689125 [Mycena metata]|uniref:Uncharacterized protein n=1 Tax=Mycena metata TaxID=1033252 RepID=A0AAD7J9N5_9AGAR|nr:hypothetical protein B0H16DRAFT_1689125 [Mycena metata]
MPLEGRKEGRNYRRGPVKKQPGPYYIHVSNPSYKVQGEPQGRLIAKIRVDICQGNRCATLTREKWLLPSWGRRKGRLYIKSGRRPPGPQALIVLETGAISIPGLRHVIAANNSESKGGFWIECAEVKDSKSDRLWLLRQLELESPWMIIEEWLVKQRLRAWRTGGSNLRTLPTCIAKTSQDVVIGAVSARSIEEAPFRRVVRRSTPTLAREDC